MSAELGESLLITKSGFKAADYHGVFNDIDGRLHLQGCAARSMYRVVLSTELRQRYVQVH